MHILPPLWCGLDGWEPVTNIKSCGGAMMPRQSDCDSWPSNREQEQREHLLFAASPHLVALEVEICNTRWNNCFATVIERKRDF
jgi:hypothetical protein